MTQEEKQLLLKDLCGRLPYGVIIETTWKEKGADENCDGTIGKLRGSQIEFFEEGEYSDIKPYLRPMSSMTEEEKKIMISYGFELIPYDTGYTGFANIENYIDEVSFRFMEEFLNSHHFDYRGLIPMGLAIESPKDMYQKP